MSQPNQHTAWPPASQVEDPAAAQWQQLVQDRLPANLESQARALKAFRRVRTIATAALLLRGLLGYVLTLSSLKELSAWSRLVGIGGVTISAQAWHKRLRQSLEWLLWLFNELLAAAPTTWDLPLELDQRILLVDATEVSCLGPKGLLWRLHCAYDLLAGQLAWVRLTSRKIGESLCLLPTRVGDILVSDGVYSRARQLVAVAQGGAFTLTRFSPHHLPLYAAHAPACRPEFQFDVRGWLLSLAPGIYERQAQGCFEQRTLTVRVLVLVPPPEQAEALRRKKEHEARAKGRKLSESSRFLAGFLLLVSTLPASPWSTALLIELYGARWQLEVLFKRIKQTLDVHTVRCETAETAQAMIVALLVAWLLIEDDLEALRRQLSDGEPAASALSSWQLARLSCQSLRQLVVGWWSPARLLALLPEFRRLFQQRRKRPLREHQRRYRFRSVLLPELASSFDCSSA